MACIMARTASTCATGELLASEDVLEGVTAFAAKTAFAASSQRGR